jgi:hypothetical protein
MGVRIFFHPGKKKSAIPQKDDQRRMKLRDKTYWSAHESILLDLG